MLIFGHRGAAGTAPENTLRAIREGLGAGADWIEIDVQAVDGALIVFHDDTLERTTNGSGPLHGLSLSALRALDAGDGERIPLLSEVLELIAGQAGLNIEIKEPGICAAVFALVHAYRLAQPAWQGHLLYSSFDAAETEKLARERGDAMLGLLFTESPVAALLRAQRLAADSIHIALEDLSAGFVTAAHDAGLRVLVYTVNDERDLRRCEWLGVDGVFTDFPARARGLFPRSPHVRGLTSG